MSKIISVGTERIVYNGSSSWRVIPRTDIFWSKVPSAVRDD
jgi:hypothetical protein